MYCLMKDMQLSMVVVVVWTNTKYGQSAVDICRSTPEPNQNTGIARLARGTNKTQMCISLRTTWFWFWKIEHWVKIQYTGRVKHPIGWYEPQEPPLLDLSTYLST